MDQEKRKGEGRRATHVSLSVDDLTRMVIRGRRRDLAKALEEMELDRIEKGVDLGVGKSFGDDYLERVEGKAARRGGRGKVKTSRLYLEDGSSS